jgi:hypothetical protein
MRPHSVSNVLGIFLQTASCCAAECQDITNELQQMCTSLMNAMDDSWSGSECSVMARAFLPGHHSILVVPCSYKCSFSVSIGSKTSTPRLPCDDTEILAMGGGRWMGSSIVIAMLTLTSLSCLGAKLSCWATKIISGVLSSKLLVLVDPIETRTAAPEADGPRCQADQGRTVGLVNSLSPCCGTIGVRCRKRRAGR